jgi:hypothetical protein
VRKKKVLVWLGIGTAAAAVTWLALPSSVSPSTTVIVVAKADNSADRPPQLRWASLPSRETIGKPAGELFSPYVWAPVQLQVAAAGGTSVSSKAVAPAMPYRIAGKVIHDGAAEIVLAKGDSVVTAREGDKLDGGYRVESIKPDHVVLLYVPLGAREKLPLSSTFIIDEKFADAPPAAAQASAPAVDSPPAEEAERVKAGDPAAIRTSIVR